MEIISSLAGTAGAGLVQSPPPAALCPCRGRGLCVVFPMPLTLRAQSRLPRPRTAPVDTGKTMLEAVADPQKEQLHISMKRALIMMCSSSLTPPVPCPGCVLQTLIN